MSVSTNPFAVIATLLPAGTLDKIDSILAEAKPKSQSDITVLALNLTDGKITAPELNTLLQAYFPNAKISPRHASYYLSKCRTGGIKSRIELSAAPPAKARKPSQPPTVDKINAMIAKMTEADRNALLSSLAPPPAPAVSKRAKKA